MAQRRQRHLRRNLLVFLASFLAHVGLFYIAAAEFNFYRLPEEREPAVQVEIVPETVQPIPPIPPPPPVKPQVAPTPQPPSPPPTPQVQPKPLPPTAARAPAQPSPAPSAPVQAAPSPTPNPTPKPTPSPTPAPLAPPAPAPQPGPPKVVSRSTLVQSQAKAVSAPRLILHKNQQAASALAPAVAIPGAIEAPSAPTGPGPGAGAPAGGQAGGGRAPGFPGGALPGFGSGLRGGVLGCANAEALHLSAAERARCAQAFGEGAKDSPQMSAIDASKRRELDREAASEAAAQKYRDAPPDSVTSASHGSYVRPIDGEPHLGHAPGE
jgi:hypothetical protein